MQNTAAASFDTTSLLGSTLGLRALLPLTETRTSEFTLNSLLNVFPDELGDNATPKLKYFGVGINGCYNVDDTNLQAAYNPSRTDMNLYKLIPIRCRPVDEDLSAAERANYRLRVRRTLSDGNEYYLYYLKVINYSDTDIKYKRINPASGAEESYELNPDYLRPTPVKPTTDTTVETTAESVVAYCDVSLDLVSDEILEYINVEYGGDTRYARVSEIGFFSGIDAEVSKYGTTYTESLYTMLYNHLTWLGVNLTSEGITYRSKFQICSNGSIDVA